MLLPYGTDKGYEDLVLETTIIPHAHDYDNEGATISTAQSPQLTKTTERSLAQA